MIKSETMLPNIPEYSIFAKDAHKDDGHRELPMWYKKTLEEERAEFKERMKQLGVLK